MIDKRPALSCAAPAGGRHAAVSFARSQDLELAVRGGGHTIPGFSTVDDGIVIDLSPMKGVRVDPERSASSPAGGTKWGDLDPETQAFGLATTGGLISRPASAASRSAAASAG